ncbi:MAG: DUF1152 domain-containing protein [Umezawaea sp.]
MSSLAEPPLFARLRDHHRILIAGAGGGFDVYAGLPLAHALRAQGKQVHLANLAFSDLDRLDIDDWLQPGLARITPDSTGSDDYFPERTLARWLAAQDLPAVVHAFPREGVRPVREGYRALADLLDLDAVVLVDGGTDILLRGDEEELGTPEEDMTSLAAVAGLDGVERLVVSLGFGIDRVCHAHVLENLAALHRDGAYLGALSIPPDSAEARSYLDAVAHAQAATPLRPSIVHGQIAAALSGEFGDVRFTDRTAGTELFVNPLMAVYLAVDLPGLARRVAYLDRLEDTETAMDVVTAIAEHRSTGERRRHRVFPH